MDDTDPRMLTGEHLVFETKKHWFAPVADSGPAVLAIIGALILAWLQSEQTTGVLGFVNRVLNLAEIALILFGVGSIIYNVIAWRSASYTVTNRRLMGQEGLARKKETDSLLSSISDVRMRQSAIGRMLGYGDIQIMSSSGEAGTDTFTTVIGAVELKKHILEEKIALGEGGSVAKTPTAAPAAAPAAGGGQTETMATLTSLAALRDSGAITPEEYEAKKTNLLARL
jgi:uncharacterized membrane protein YdbT with pleckstrin-like domain